MQFSEARFVLIASKNSLYFVLGLKGHVYNVLSNTSNLRALQNMLSKKPDFLHEEFLVSRGKRNEVHSEKTS
jgi:hypothetical protein